MRVTVLHYLLHEGDSGGDAVVGQVAGALERLGHEVSVLGVHGDVHQLVSGLTERRPDLVFNLLESFGETIHGDVAVAGIFELLGLRHTGGGAGELYLQMDKALAKKLLAWEGLLYPDFAVFPRGAGFETGGRLRMPLFVKPLRADASIGIGADSLVHTAGELMARVVKIHEDHKDDALAEEYIEGRELYVGVLGNAEPLALPPVEIDFTGMPDGAPRILDARAKWQADSAEFAGTRAIVPDLPPELRARLQEVAVGACRALRVRDYGRVDLRLTESGDIHVLEVNASPYLEASGELVMAAKAAGLDYDALIGRIVELAIARWEDGTTDKLPRRARGR